MLFLYGGVAQLGEHLPCKQGVKGSIPFISTNNNKSTFVDQDKCAFLLLETYIDASLTNRERYAILYSCEVIYYVFSKEISYAKKKIQAPYR